MAYIKVFACLILCLILTRYCAANNNNEGCLLAYMRQSLSTRSCGFTGNDIDTTRINSDEFLETLATAEYRHDTIKAAELIDLARKLSNNDTHVSTIMTGNSIQLASEVLLSGGLMRYRWHQRTSSVINRLWNGLLSSSSFRMLTLSSRSLSRYTASTGIVLRTTLAAITKCAQLLMILQNDDVCIYGSTALLVSSTGLISYTTVNMMAPQFFPSIIEKFTTNGFRAGLQVTYRYLSSAYRIVGLGLTLWDIIRAARRLDNCLQLGAACSIKDKVDFIVAVSFSITTFIVSVGFIVTGATIVWTLPIAIALILFQGIALSINTVIAYTNEYHTTADENARLFFHSLVLLPPPLDVQALKERSDWINHLQKRARQVMKHHDKIIAYAIGIGHFANKNNGANSSYGYINMKILAKENTKGLSRVIPKSDNTTLLLCLPKKNDNALYEKFTTEEPQALYKCDNAFVIADKRWKNNKNHENHYIVYDLEYMNSGEIIGSDIVNNNFITYSSDLYSQLTITGGGGNTTNSFVIKKQFSGKIRFNKKSRSNILDYSAVKTSDYINFVGFNESLKGYIEFDRRALCALESQGNISQLHVIGRMNKQDRFNCANGSGKVGRYNFISQIYIDGGGGESHLKLDELINCQISKLYPFTKIIGTVYSADSSYITYVPLSSFGYNFNDGYNDKLATIEPQNASRFTIIFTKFPVFASTYSVTYSSIEKTLIWKLDYEDDSVLSLVVAPYRRVESTIYRNTNDRPERESITSVFVDSYFNTTIFPIIKQLASANETAMISVRHFDILGIVYSDKLPNVYIHYLNIISFAHYDYQLYFAVQLIYPQTGKIFIFGSIDSDRFHIDPNTTFLFGNDGNDIYLMTQDSPCDIWIDNEASDSALDTLVMPNSTCEFLRAKRGSLASAGFDDSELDVTLICSTKNKTEQLPQHNIVLRNYLMGSSNRHLQIYWRDALYALMTADDWTMNDINSKTNDNTIDPALVVTFNEESDNMTLLLTNRDTVILLNITDDDDDDIINNPLVAYMSEVHDLILTKKYVNGRTSLIVILQNFFDYRGNVSSEWQQVKIFIYNNGIAHDSILTVNGIIKLLESSNGITDNINNIADDLIKEYNVNVTSTSRREFVIDHNNDEAVLDG